MLTCHTTDKVCETSVLGRVVFDSIGTGGHHSEYAVDATLKVIEVSRRGHAGTQEAGTHTESRAYVRLSK